MSVDSTRMIYGWFVSSSTITSLINSSDIHMGFPKIKDNYPCISITQAGGTEVGRLGYGTATAGSKMRETIPTYQIDIWSKQGFYQVDQIGDEVSKVMISGACRKNSDNHGYDDETGLYRKIMSFTFTQFFDD